MMVSVIRSTGFQLILLVRLEAVPGQNLPGWKLRSIKYKYLKISLRDESPQAFFLIDLDS